MSYLCPSVCQEVPEQDGAGAAVPELRELRRRLPLLLRPPLQEVPQCHRVANTLAAGRRRRHQGQEADQVKYRSKEDTLP